MTPIKIKHIQPSYIPTSKLRNFLGGHVPSPPRNVSSVWPNVPGFSAEQKHATDNKQQYSIGFLCHYIPNIPLDCCSDWKAAVVRKLAKLLDDHMILQRLNPLGPICMGFTKRAEG